MCDIIAVISVSIPPAPICGNLRVRGRRSSRWNATEI